VEHHGSQCGYCTPGFICSLFEGFYRDDLKTGDDLDEQLAGNLCRCTGYRPIRDAAIEAFACRRRGDEAQTEDDLETPHVVAYKDDFAERLKNADIKLNAVNFENDGENFFRPTALAELFRLRKDNPDARPIAGATEMGLEITKRYKKFPTLISTEAIAELKNVECANDEWRIGAAVTLTEIYDKLAEEFPALGDMLRVFGSRQIRNRATMGGNLVTASPIGDSAPVLLALDAKVVLVGQASSLSPFKTEKLETGATPVLRERTLPIGEFFVAYRKTALEPGEILKTILIPREISAPNLTRKSKWFKVSKRREMDISTVAACFVVDLDSQNVIRHVRLGYGGVAAMPLRARKTEAALLGKAWSKETIQTVLPILQTEFTPISDVRGSAEYRSGLITSLLEKFFTECSARVSRAGLGVTPEPSSDKLMNLVGRDFRRNPKNPPPVAGATSIPNESAHKHVTGEAVYTDDFAARKNMLEVWPVCAPPARAKILKRDASSTKTMPGIAAVLLAEDLPGLKDVGAVRHDEILLADKEVF